MLGFFGGRSNVCLHEVQSCTIPAQSPFFTTQFASQNPHNFLFFSRTLSEGLDVVEVSSKRNDLQLSALKSHYSLQIGQSMAVNPVAFCQVVLILCWYSFVPLSGEISVSHTIIAASQQSLLIITSLFCGCNILLVALFSGMVSVASLPLNFSPKTTKMEKRYICFINKLSDSFFWRCKKLLLKCYYEEFLSLKYFRPTCIAQDSTKDQKTPFTVCKNLHWFQRYIGLKKM